LLAAGFYDRVHDDLFVLTLGTDFHRASDYSLNSRFLQIARLGKVFDDAAFYNRRNNQPG
jgi:hypothetical protein